MSDLIFSHTITISLDDEHSIFKYSKILFGFSEMNLKIFSSSNGNLILGFSSSSS